MLNYNFIRISTFILIILLFFSVSVYDPSVYAKMQVMEDDYLAQIEGETGVTIGLNLTVRAVATGVSLSNGLGDAINFGVAGTTSDSIFIGNGTTTGSFTVSANVTQDVGTGSGITGIYTTGPVLPSSAGGIGILINNFNVNVDGTNYKLGPNATTAYPSLWLQGMFMGRDVTSINGTAIYPTLTGTVGTRVGITYQPGHTGLALYQQTSMYINEVSWDWGEGGYANDQFHLYGIYMYGANNNVPSITGAGALRAGWVSTLSGGMIIGNNGTSDVWATVDEGGNGSANGTILRLSLPNVGSMRIGNLWLGGSDFGPAANDNQYFTRLLITVRHLNASGY